MKRLQSDTRLFALYQTFVAKHFSPFQGRRNTDVVRMMTFLYRAVEQGTALELVRQFYLVNQDVFVDRLEKHMGEAKAHLQRKQS